MNNFPNIMQNNTNQFNNNLNFENQNFQTNTIQENKKHNDSTKQNKNINFENSIKKENKIIPKKKKEIEKKFNNKLKKSSIILNKNKDLFDYNEYIKVSKEKNKEVLEFKDIKKELNDMVENIIKNYLKNKDYELENAQSWCNNISDEIIKTLHQQQRGLKFVCATTIFQKRNSSLHFSSTCLWNPSKDGSITVKYENDTMHCFVSLFGLDKQNNKYSYKRNLCVKINLNNLIINFLLKEGKKLIKKYSI